MPSTLCHDGLVSKDWRPPSWVASGHGCPLKHLSNPLYHRVGVLEGPLWVGLNKEGLRKYSRKRHAQCCFLATIVLSNPLAQGVLHPALTKETSSGDRFN